MTSAEKWAEDDILNLLRNQVEENLRLDYKAAPALAKTEKAKADLSKDVSAFANSAGGLLIYGVTEKDHLPDAIDPIDPDVITKEWIEQVINSRIQRRIAGVRIFPIALSDANRGRVVYVVSVPVSPDAPHQACDKLYYKRFNFLSTAMEDYEIRDISSRRRHPVVVAVLGTHMFDSRPQLVSASLQVSLVNNGAVLADKVYLELQVPRVALGKINKFDGDVEASVVEGAEYRTFKYYHRDSGGALPLFPGAKKDIFDGNKSYLNIEIPGDVYRLEPSLAIICTVFSDGAAPNTTSVLLRDFMDGELEKRRK